VLAGLERSRPLEEICAELAIPTTTGRRIVAKLIRLGALRTPGARARAFDPAPFSEAEEAFFASEVRLDPWAEPEEPQPTLWARARALVSL
jgi:DNA-binding IclR family transcriptional regulator